jgi:hypothetical protein
VLGGFARPAPVPAFPPASTAPIADLEVWLSEVARVRDGLEPLDLLLLLAADVFPSTQLTTSDGVEVAVLGAPTGEALVLDGWSESAPPETATTGVAFHYDAPRSQPPQVVLIAVPPPSVAWSLSVLEAIVDETIASAKQRTIAPEDVRSQVAPALLVVDDPSDLVPAIDLTHVVITDVTEVLR